MQDSERNLDIGATFHVLYHLYNWHQLMPLLPGSKTEVLERLEEIKELVSDGDREAILATVAELYQFNMTLHRLCPPKFAMSVMVRYAPLTHPTLFYAASCQSSIRANV
ncbi:MAG: hypothetical protein SW833_01480 [Cyanobacteriota bacterium]|nr:hypothetical protein [Cyanobacteriota bacterium]